jgi:hypothetical protein
MAGAKKRRERGHQSFFAGVSKPKLRWASRLTLVLLRQELERYVRHTSLHHVPVIESQLFFDVALV